MKNLLILILLAILPVLFSGHRQLAIVNVDDYGAAGNGTTDDGAAIQAAFDYVMSNGGGTVNFTAGKIYGCGRRLYVGSNTSVEGNGATIQSLASLPALGLNLFIGNGTGTSYSNLSTSIAVTKGSYSFTYPQASSLTVGENVYLKGVAYATYSGAAPYTTGWYSYITAITGTTVTLAQPADYTFTSTAIYQYKTTKNSHFRNLVVNANDINRTDGYGLGFKNARNCTVESCTVNGLPVTGLAVGIFMEGVDLTVTHCFVHNIESQSDPGYGYDVQGHNISVMFSKTVGAATGATSAVRDYIATGINFFADTINTGGSWTPLDFHANSQGTMDGNVIYHSNPTTATFHGAHLRRGNSSFTNNTLYTNNTGGGTMIGLFLFEEADNNILVSGNKFIMKGSGGTSLAIQKSSSAHTRMGNSTIYGNYFEGGGVAFGGTIDPGLVIRKNRFQYTDAYASTLNFGSSTAADYLVDSNTFVNTWANVWGTGNYSVSTPSTATHYGVIRTDTVYIMNAANLYPQFRINNTIDSVYGNVIYTPNTAFIKDYSGTTGINYYGSNTRINGIGTPSPYNPDTSGGSTGTDTIPPIVENNPPPENTGLRVYWKQKQF